MRASICRSGLANFSRGALELKEVEASDWLFAARRELREGRVIDRFSIYFGILFFQVVITSLRRMGGREGG